MTAGIEIELKFLASPEAIDALRRDPALFGPAAATRHQLSTYFDTETHALNAAGLSLRVRHIGDRRVQTVKAESAGAASLFARDEWEHDIQGDEPVLDDITVALAKTLGTPPDAVVPVFVTDVHRTAMLHDTGDDRIELVADSGRIVAADRTAPISEIELELKAGDSAALFALARRIAATTPLRLGMRSKSERGYGLLSAKRQRAIKAEPLALDGDMDTAGLFAAVAMACLRHFRLNEDVLLETRAAEPLHQARVALRRLRSALTIFREMLAGERLDHFRAELRWISGLLGEVRNIDVLIPRIDDTAALATLHAARDARADELVAALDSPRMRGLMLDLAEWIAIGAWREDSATAETRATPARIFAHGTLDRLRRRLKRQGRNLTKLDEDARHEVRITGKKLRYAAEFFAALFPGKKAGRRRTHFLGHLADLQTALGDLNDLASGRDLLASLGVADGEALLHGGKRAPPKKLLAQAEDAYDQLIDRKRFWR